MKKRLMSFITAFVVFNTFTVNTFATQKNIIINGDFNHSFSGEWRADGNTTAEICTENENNYLSQTGRLESWHGVRQSVELVNGREYRISADIRVPEPGKNRYFLYAKNGENYNIVGNQTELLPNKWTSIEGYYIASENGADITDIFASEYVVENPRPATVTETDNYSVLPKFYPVKSSIIGSDYIKKGESTAFTAQPVNQEGTCEEMNFVSTEWSIVEDTGGEISVDECGTVSVGNAVADGLYTVRAVHNDYGITISCEKHFEVGDGERIYVSKNGNDSNAGSQKSPFLTIQKAADTANPGDTVVIHGGIYRECVIPKNSGTASSPITFRGYAGESVVMSGAEILDGEWADEGNGIYSISCDSSVSELYVDGVKFNIARWPNSSPDKLFEESAYANAVKGEYEYYTAELPEGLDVNGASIHMWPGSGWYAKEKTIYTDATPGKLIFDTAFNKTDDGLHSNDPYKPAAGDRFYLYGKQSFLDSPGEWIAENGRIYIAFGAEKTPRNTVTEIKTRENAFDLTNKRNINITELSLFGCALNMSGTQCVADKLEIKYPSAVHNQAVKLHGSYNTIKNSYIAYAVGDGINLRGQYNTVQNNIIHDVNSYGDYYGAVGMKELTYDGGNVIGNNIIHNTMYNSGRFIVYHSQAEELEITFNEMYGGGLLTKDLGAIYTWGTDGKNTVIAYNYIHDMGQNRGIYLDNGSENYKVHHNVIANVGRGITLNCPSLNNVICNNTLKNIFEYSFDYYAYQGTEPSQNGTVVANNIIEGNVSFVTGNNAPETHHNTEAITNEKFYSEDERTVDKGVIIEGITDDYLGAAPDIGAFEYGAVMWLAGASGQ